MKSKINEIIPDKLPEFRCIYCKKTASEAHMMQFRIQTIGTYFQCYDVRKTGKDKFCPENKDFINPVGKREYE